jgi:hypothetical protein
MHVLCYSNSIDLKRRTNTAAIMYLILYCQLNGKRHPKTDRINTRIL